MFVTNLPNFTINNTAAQHVNHLESGKTKAGRLNFAANKETDDFSTDEKVVKHPVKALIKGLMSLIFPGLGQIANGKTIEGLKKLIPSWLVSISLLTAELTHILSKDPEKYTKFFKKAALFFNPEKLTEEWGQLGQKTNAIFKTLSGFSTNVAKFIETHTATLKNPATRKALHIGTKGLAILWIIEHIRSAIDAYKGEKLKISQDE